MNRFTSSAWKKHGVTTTQRGATIVVAAQPQQQQQQQRHLAASALLAMDYEFPGLPAVSPQPAKASSISVSTLENGMKVITENSNTLSSFSLTYPFAGSSSELITEYGAAYLNKHMNYKSGSGLSTIAINRTIEEDSGSGPYSMIDRYGVTMGCTSPILPEKLYTILPLFATSCTFEKWDVRDAKEAAMKESAVAKESLQITLTEQLFASMYGPQTVMGRPIYGSSPSCTLDALQSFRQRAYGVNTAILAVTGITDHTAFCTEVSHLLSESPIVTDPKPTSSSYLGGESRISIPSMGYAHVALAFDATGTSKVVSDVVIEYLTLCGMDQNITGLAATPNGTVIGLYSGSESTTSSTMMDSIVSILKAVPSSEHVQRAKTLAKAKALLAYDNATGSADMVQILASSVRNNTIYTSLNDVSTAYDSVSQQQVTSTIATMIKTNPSLAAVGDITYIPYHATIAQMLK